VIKELNFICFYFCLLSVVFAQQKETDYSIQKLHHLIKTSKEKDQIDPLLKL